jgi:hypothetical protein
MQACVLSNSSQMICSIGISVLLAGFFLEEFSRPGKKNKESAKGFLWEKKRVQVATISERKILSHHI